MLLHRHGAVAIELKMPISQPLRATPEGPAVAGSAGRRWGKNGESSFSFLGQRDVFTR